MRRSLAMLILGAWSTGCGGDDEALAYPDAGPDLLPGVTQGPDDCGPWSAYVVGLRRDWLSRFGAGGAFESTTVVDSFDGEGMITETLITGDPEDFHGEGTNHFLCDADGLRSVDTSFDYMGPDGTVYYYEAREFDPPVLQVPRSLEIGSTWTDHTTRYFYSSNGDDVADLDVVSEVTAVQLVATAAGSWPALLVEDRDFDSGIVIEREWRAAGVGLLLSSTFNDGVPGYTQELIGLHDEAAPE